MAMPSRGHDAAADERQPHGMHRRRSGRGLLLDVHRARSQARGEHEAKQLLGPPERRADEAERETLKAWIGTVRAK